MVDDGWQMRRDEVRAATTRVQQAAASFLGCDAWDAKPAGA